MQDSIYLQQLAINIKEWGQELGFQQVGITDIDLALYEERLTAWLQRGWHGSMDYMEKHGTKRSRPEELVPGTKRIISVRMDYLAKEENLQDARLALKKPHKAYISRYALGRDYHKLLRQRLQKLAAKISASIPTTGYRVFVDSAPVLEKSLAAKAGLGWIGKNTLVINRHAGSWFFLGEIYTDIPLPIDAATSSHCGSCSACIKICPTQAIIAPYQLDARRCISYLTIENKGAIPEELRPLMGNRIFGCDDCQLICPWNRYANFSAEKDFKPRHNLGTAELIDLFLWSEEEFLQKTEGSAIRRAGYIGWLRNIAIALGNAPYDHKILIALKERAAYPSPLVQEHILWAITNQLDKKEG